MKRNALLAALGLSLLFNIFVLVGFMQSRSKTAQAADEPKRLEQLARDLNLNDSQAQLMQRLREDQRRQSALIDENVAVVRQEIAAELRKASPDLDRLRTLVDQEADLYRQRRQINAELYSRFVGGLSPAQRQTLGQRADHPARTPQVPHRILERFDRDHNGRLEPEEWQWARQEMERRRRDFPQPPRPNFNWREFDANRDGRLDESEIAAMERSRPQRPRPPADQPRGASAEGGSPTED